MARTKGKAKRKAPPPEPAQPAAEPSMRVTRAAAKRAAASSGSGSVAELPKPPKKRAKKAEAAGKAKQQEGDSENAGDASKKTIVIEHCEQSSPFKTRATRFKEGLEERVPGITVTVNPEKPRRGCFEIREEGGEKFISLLNMKHPFKPMEDLDTHKVIADIIDKIN